MCPAETAGARFHVGDTPMDLLAAQEAGAQACNLLSAISLLLS